VSVAKNPHAVLFCCNFNRVRSVMAEALLKRHVGKHVFVDSCGVKSMPEEEKEGFDVDPFVFAVLLEVGWDVAHHRSKTFDELNDDSFDLVISLTPQAQHRAVELARGQATEIEYWPTMDPTLVEGSREHRLAAYREVRDALEARIAERFDKLASWD
jgi:protein-tyrosine-phosphatase